MMALLSWLVAILLVSSVYQTWSITKCPQHVAIEKGTNYSINCTTASDVNDFYWYKGPADDQDLIGKLESGTVTISKTYMGNYDVSRSGALLILNARVTHEYLYDLVTYDGNYNPEEERVIVNITISPESSCPLINNCTSCTKCDLLKTEKSSGTLTCRVERSRPAVPLRWKTLDQNGVAVTFHPQIQKGDASTDTWNSSVSLNYNFKVPCGAKITLQCLAEDTQHILNSEVSTTEISTGPCNPGTVANLPLGELLTTSSPENSNMAAVLIPVLLILFGIVVIVAIVKLRNARNTDQGAPPGLPLIPHLDPELAEEFILTLKDKSREKFCFLQPLPWGDKIGIDHLYADSLCKVTTQNGETFEVTSTELTKTKNITNQRLVTFIGEHGDGRTTFFKNVLCEWRKGMEELYLVIFIPLKEVKKDKSLSKYLMEDILNTNKFEIALVEAILKSEDKYCLVILDGLEDLPKPFGNGKRDRNTEDLVTIDEILRGHDRDIYRNCHVWISSREEDWKSSRCPNHDVRVEMKGFSANQLSNYIKKCCWYYYNKTPGALNEHATVEDNKVYGEVQNFFQENKILEDYGNTPLFINLMIHIMAMNFTSGIPDLPKEAIENTGELVHVVVQCMKRRHQNKHPKFSNDEFSIIENKLGETALSYKTRLEDESSKFWKKQIGEKYVKTACDIGLLKLIKDCTVTAKYSGIEFHHQHIQEYLAALAVVKYHKNSEDWKQMIENWGNEDNDRLMKFIEELKGLSTASLD